MKLTFKRRPWSVPSERRAFEGWLEGRPTEAQREAVLAKAREERAAWKPDADAWKQLIQLQSLIGKRVTIQFWSSSMWLLAEDEWPTLVIAKCEGIVTLIDDNGFLQPFLVLRDALDGETREPSESPYLVERAVANGKLAPVAEIHEIEAVPEAT